jgi:hypothetical protein
VPTYAYEFNDQNAPERYLSPVGFPYGAAYESEVQYLFSLQNTPFPGVPATPPIAGPAATSVPDMTNAHEVVAAYWATAEARDWDAFGALLARDVIYRGPQAREQVRGREAYIRFNAEGFPYEWHISVQRIVGEGQHAASWIEITVSEGIDTGLCFFDLADDGKIALITDFFPQPYELPASRAHLVEHY